MYYYKFTFLGIGSTGIKVSGSGYCPANNSTDAFKFAEDSIYTVYTPAQLTIKSLVVKQLKNKPKYL